MPPSLLHGWDLSRDDARRLQQSLAAAVMREDDFPVLRVVAGVHVGYPRTPSGSIVGRAAVVVLRLPDLDIIDQHVVLRPVTFPHVPGYESFREAPLALAAINELVVEPDLLMVDGHGVSHAKRFGVASHLGILLDLPTIGCSTSVPVGVAAEPLAHAGAWSPLRDADEVIGAAVHSRAGSRPLYVSSGHRIGLESAVGVVLELTRGHRQPEPIRLAVRLAAQQQA